MENTLTAREGKIYEKVYQLRPYSPQVLYQQTPAFRINYENVNSMKDLNYFKDQVAREFKQGDGVPFKDWAHFKYMNSRKDVELAHDRAATLFAEHERKELRLQFMRIMSISEDEGRAGCTWGDTEYDSLSVVFGYNRALAECKEIAEKALKE